MPSTSIELSLTTRIHEIYFPVKTLSITHRQTKCALITTCVAQSGHLKRKYRSQTQTNTIPNVNVPLISTPAASIQQEKLNQASLLVNLPETPFAATGKQEKTTVTSITIKNENERKMKHAYCFHRATRLITILN